MSRGERLAGTAYRLLFDGVLARMDAERAHRLGFAALRAAAPLTDRLPSARTGATADPAHLHREIRPSRRERSDPGRRVGAFAQVQALGLTFHHALGLAAGFDKNGVGIDALAALGFGHVEIGTVTAEPQPGNPRPRLFRLPEDRALVNRMGFNNDGAEVVARRLAVRQHRLAAAHEPTRADSALHLRRLGTLTSGVRADSQADSRVVVGVNIGRTKRVPEDQAVADYEKSTRLLAPYADYLVINVSSPNTPGLRGLQAVERLEPLLVAVRRQADAVTQRRVPLLVKIAPDLADAEVAAVADLAGAVGLDGIVATNTTTARTGLRTSAAQVEAAGAGGLSGPPLGGRALEVLRILRNAAPGLTLVAVGGITTAADARARLDAGATLLQAYTAFVYEGPRWPRRLLRAMAAPPAPPASATPRAAPATAAQPAPAPPPATASPPGAPESRSSSPVPTPRPHPEERP